MEIGLKKTRKDVSGLRCASGLKLENNNGGIDNLRNM